MVSGKHKFTPNHGFTTVVRGLQHRIFYKEKFVVENKKMKVEIKSQTLFCFLYSILFTFFSPFNAIATTEDALNNSNKSFVLKNVAMLPFENLSENPVAKKVIAELVKKELMSKGWVSIVKDNAIEEFLAKRRIRYTGGITRLTAREMGKVLGVDAILVGSINQFSDANARISVAVTARLVGVDGNIIWADTLSYTGNDFVGLLGLGVIKSADVLSLRVVRDIVKDITIDFFITKEAGLNLNPFEIEKVETYPSVAKGGDRVELKVRVLSITNEPDKIKAVVDNNEVSLTKTGNNEYDGFITAPTNEGVYPVAVVAIDQSHASFIFDAAGKIIIDSTPPMVSLTISKKTFAPQRDFVLFTPKMLNLDYIDEWAIEIFDKDKNKVRGDKGYGKLPKGLIWKGETDKLGRVEDGEYTYKFIVKDMAGNETILADTIRGKNNPPAIKVNVEKVENKVLFTFDYNPDEAIKSWKLSILDNDGKPIKTVEGEGGFPPTVEYPVEQGFDITKMSFAVTAKDEADNPFNLAKSIPSALDKKSPLAKANGKGKLAEDF